MHTSSNFLKAIFQKFYLVHFWILCLILVLINTWGRSPVRNHCRSLLLIFISHEIVKKHMGGTNLYKKIGGMNLLYCFVSNRDLHWSLQCKKTVASRLHFHSPNIWIDLTHVIDYMSSANPYLTQNKTNVSRMFSRVKC